MMAVNFLDANIVWPNATWVRDTGTLDFSLLEVDNSSASVDASRISNLTLSVTTTQRFSVFAEIRF